MIFLWMKCRAGKIDALENAPLAWRLGEQQTREPG
jgi:hypothetical protein